MKDNCVNSFNLKNKENICFLSIIIRPDESDIAITRKKKDPGTLMEIQLLDHLIIVPEGKCYSMADEGIM